MKNILMFLFLLSLALSACTQNYKYPGQLEIRDYKIGDKVDTTLFNKYDNLYFPNYLDGWTMDNVDKLPEKYKGLPIAIWQLKSDSSIALTLLNNVILNITVSYMKEEEIKKLSEIFTERFGAVGKAKSYEETHPLQSLITYWHLTNWEMSEAIAQTGNSELRMPDEKPTKDISWNLVYSDFLIENKIISQYKNKVQN